MTVLAPALRAALKWLKAAGGDCAVARTRAGGRIYLAQGETGAFTAATAKRLCTAGSRSKARLRLTAAGRAAA